MTKLNTAPIHPSWLAPVEAALSAVSPNYLTYLEKNDDWLPGSSQIFNAFSLPLPEVRYLLFGESPYPRAVSANGYAFWDANVIELWSAQGMTTPVNRATSLRNLLKMLLLAAGDLTPEDTSQAAIARVNKASYVTTLAELFNNLREQGFLLLNAALVYRPKKLREDARAWLPFIEKILASLSHQKNNITLLLFGKVAQIIGALPKADAFSQLSAEHPYNISFIFNPTVLNFFRPLHLLRKKA